MGALSLLRYSSRQPSQPKQLQSPPAAEVQHSFATKMPNSDTERPKPTTRKPITAVPEDSPEQKHQAYVDSRVSELLELAMNDDPASFETIMRELENRDPAIRRAAIEAAVQFGSRDAIPRLTDAASHTDNADEKVQIAEAIEFLQLPSLSETLAQN